MNLSRKNRLLTGLLALLILSTLLISGAVPVAGAGGPVDTYGQLQVIGNQLCDRSGNPVALRGMSLFWSNWDTGFYNSNVVQWLRDDWKCTVVRAALGIEPLGAYLSNPEAQKQKITAVVDAAINLGMYVIIDWHDHNAHNHTQQAKEFFAAMAQRYGSYPNVLYEIYNEPESVGWTTVKAYAEEVIAAIRQHDPDNIIIVGTPNWSQYVDAAADNPIRQSNIMYTLHFYAATHKQWLRDKATYALNKGIALFVSEWGTSEATGDGTLDYSESDIWIDFMLKNNLSWCNWSLFTKEETSAALLPGAGTNGGWDSSQLSASGKYVREKLISLNSVVPSISPSPSPSLSPSPSPSPTQIPSPSPTGTSGSGCTVAYTMNDWGSGATVTITLKNNGTVAINNWKLEFSFPGNQQITNLWCAKYTQSGAAVTASGESWNSVIQPGGTVSFGFNISYSGANVKPTSFTLNGVACQVL